MEIQRAINIAKREWENIRVSLKQCGDIGECNYENNPNEIDLLSHSPCLITHSLDMENKYETYRYFTKEASHVFSALASLAGKRLGMSSRLAQTFGGGYSWVRTGCLSVNENDNRCLLKQLFFMKLFFPIGGFFNWDFDTDLTKTKMRLVFSTFNIWRKDPETFIKDVEDYREQLEPLWRGVSSSLGLNEKFPDLCR